MKYVKKSTIVEAMEWTGDNLDEIRAFAGPHLEEIPLDGCANGLRVIVPEGEMWARAGDMIIKEDGMIYPILIERFEKFYSKL